MADRPNILLITTDQQRFDTISALGNQEIYTPHLDWLTEEGITFTRAYADCPICVPSRTTIMNGKHGYSSGMVNNGGMEKVMEGRPSLPGLLTAAGYQTRAQGKMHFGPMRCNYGFEHMELPMDYYRERHARAQEGLPKEHGVGENEITPVISTVHENESLTHWTVKRSIDFLETRDETRPFFMWTSFTKPHPPFDPCANYWALYANRPVSEPVRGDWSKTVEEMPQGFLESTYCLNNAYRMSTTQLQDVKRAYYACITQIDYQLGLLFARMREMELLENTWIIFTADHGDMLGDHHLGAKAVFFEGASHVPMIIRPPAKSWDNPKPRAGEKVDKIVDLADVMPTILKIAGIDGPDDLDGQDMLSLEEDRVFFGASTNSQYGVIKDNLKLCYCSSGDAELLFDLNEDPKEERNLVGHPDYDEKLKDLRAILIDKVSTYLPDKVEDGKIKSTREITGPGDVVKWPGLHSTVVPTDVLH